MCGSTDYGILLHVLYIVALASLTRPLLKNPFVHKSANPNVMLDDGCYEIICKRLYPLATSIRNRVVEQKGRTETNEQQRKEMVLRTGSGYRRKRKGYFGCQFDALPNAQRHGNSFSIVGLCRIRICHAFPEDKWTRLGSDHD